MNKIEAIHVHVHRERERERMPFISIKGHKELGMVIQCHLVTGLSNQLLPAGMHEAFSFPT